MIMTTWSVTAILWKIRSKSWSERWPSRNMFKLTVKQLSTGKGTVVAAPVRTTISERPSPKAICDNHDRWRKFTQSKEGKLMQINNVIPDTQLFRVLAVEGWKFEKKQSSRAVELLEELRLVDRNADSVVQIGSILQGMVRSDLVTFFKR